MTAPLDGIKVLEIGVAMAGPYCGLMLADYGADVIKVERPGSGDESRNWPPFFDGQVSHYFAAVNRNKRSLAIDMKSAEGADILRRLAAKADVVIDNFRLGVLDQLGLGYEALSKINERLIYCRITGFGASGPRSGERANDAVMQAYAGGMSLTGEPDGGPVKMGISVADIGAGMFATIGILMALQARHTTGRGQIVDTSLLEGQVAMLANHFASFFSTGHPPPRRGSGGQNMVPYQAFLAQDEWMVVASFTERMWRGVCAAIDRPEWGDDPRYHNAKVRAENREELVAKLAEVFRQQPIAYWEARLRAEGIPFTPVNTVDRVAKDEQTLARDMIVSVDHPQAGTLSLTGLPIKFAETPGAVRTAPPLLGQHSVEIARKVGLGESEVSELLRRGVLEAPREEVSGAKAAIG
jgi:crotonobetainyl-CoA:carnitine CoA-transferase CaiB-like acyl-CoA transferase